LTAIIFIDARFITFYHCCDLLPAAVVAKLAEKKPAAATKQEMSPHTFAVHLPAVTSSNNINLISKD